MTTRRVILSILLSIAILVLVPLVLLFTRSELYLGPIEGLIRSNSGFDAEIGALNLDLFPLRGEVEELTLTNPRIKLDTPILKINQARLHLDLGGWLQQTGWWSAQANGVEVIAGESPGGEKLWDNGRPAEPEPGNPLSGLEALKVNQMKFERRGKEEVQRLQVNEFSLQREAEQRLRVNLDSRYRDQPVTAEGTLALPDQEQAQRVNFQISAPGVDLKLSGTLGRKGEPGQYQLSTQVQNLELARMIMDQDLDTRRELLQVFLPLSLDLEVQVAPDQVLTLTPINLTTGGNKLAGKLEINPNTDPPAISGELTGQSLDLNDFPIAKPENSSKKKPNEKKTTDKPVFSDRPLDWNRLNWVQLDLKLRLEKFDINQTHFRNIHTRLILQDRQLTLEPIEADLSKGGIEGFLRIHQNRTGAGVNINTRLIVEQLTPADLGRRGEGIIDGGSTDLLIDLQTRGASPHDLAAALDGEMVIEVQNAKLRNDIFERLGSDLLMQTINLINPFVQSDENTNLDCAAARFQANDGILTSPDQIAFETEKVKVRGGGKINLKTEALQIDFQPTAREGLGIGIGDLARFVRLGGTLSNPQPVADPEGILKSGATIGAAITTGGMSLLAQGLFKRAQSGGTACGRIFEAAAEDEG